MLTGLMQGYTKRNSLILFITVIIGFCLFYWIGLGSYALLRPDEARYAEIAREMLVSGNYITPRLNHMIFFDKPILYYWLTSFAINIFGATEFAARFFPAVIGVVGLAATYFFCRFISNHRSAIFAVLILGTAPLYWGAAHYSNMDLMVATFVTISLYCFWSGIQLREQKLGIALLYSSYVLSALAILTKGLLGFVFPCAIIGLWILFSHQWRIILKMRLVTGLILIAMIIAPWFYLVQKQNPEFFHYFFVVQQWQRYLTSNFNSQHGLWFYPVVILVGMFPWSLFIFNAMYRAIQKVFKKHKNYQVQLFLLIWFLFVLTFFSLPASKIVGYILPTLPPIAILIAIQIDSIWIKNRYLIKKAFPILVAIIVLGEIAAISIAAHKINSESIKPLANKIQPLLTKNSKLVTYFNTYYDLGFYTGYPIYIVANWSKPNLINEDNWKGRFKYAATYDKQQEKYLMSPTKFQALWHKNTPIFILLKRSHLKWIPFHDYYQITANNKYIVISNVETKQLKKSF